MSVLKYKQVKTEAEIKLQDVDVQFQMVDNNIEAVVVSDTNGNYIRIVKGGTYSDTLKVLVEQPKEYKTIYNLIVKQEDGGVLHYEIDSQEEAESKGEQATRYGGTFTVTPVQKEVKKDLQNKVIEDLPF